MTKAGAKGVWSSFTNVNHVFLSLGRDVVFQVTANACLLALAEPRDLTDGAAAVEKVTSSRMSCLSPEKLAVKSIV